MAIGTAWLLRFFHDFVMEFDDSSSQDPQHGSPVRGHPIVPTASRSGPRLEFTAEPSIALHAIQERIQCSRADVVAVPAKLREEPLAVDTVFCGVMEDVHLPETKEDLAGQKLWIRRRHSASLYDEAGSWEKTHAIDRGVPPIIVRAPSSLAARHQSIPKQ